VQRSNSPIILVGQIVAGVFSLLSVTLTARYAGSTIFGFCSIAILVSALAMTVIDFGAVSWSARELASGRISGKTYGQIMRMKSRVNLLLLLFIPIVFLQLDSERYAVLCLAIYPFLWNRYNFIQQYLITTNQAVTSSILVVVERFCWLLIVPMQFFRMDRVLSCVLPIVFGLFVHYSIGNRFIPSEQPKSNVLDLKISQYSLFKKTRYFGFSSFSSAIANLDGVFVTIASSLTSAGGYLLAQRFRNPMMLVFSSIAIRIRPIASLGDTSLIRLAIRSDSKLLFIGISGNIAIAVVLFNTSGQLFGSSFENIQFVMLIGVLTSIPLGIASIVTSVLNSTGYEAFVSKNIVWQTFVTLLGVVTSTYFAGSLGAVSFTFMFAIMSCLVFYVKLAKVFKHIS
jgi:O-antigen/teichoic acid export membrane protein